MQDSYETPYDSYDTPFEGDKETQALDRFDARLDAIEANLDRLELTMTDGFARIHASLGRLKASLPTKRFMRWCVMGLSLELIVGFGLVAWSR
jgi:hypothetical protein